MCKCKWIGPTVTVLALLAAGGWLGSYLTVQAAGTAAAQKAGNCCDDPACLPGCSPECPPDCVSVASVKAAVSAKAHTGLDCCNDPTCPPGCSADCPPDCLDAKVKAGNKAKADCPPCPFCP